MSNPSLIWIVLVIVFATTSGAFAYLYASEKAKSDTEPNNKSCITDLVTPTPTQSNTNLNINTSTTNQNTNVNNNTNAPDSSNNLSAAENIAEKFMDARIDRSLAQARPYITNDYATSTSQDEFAGTSSPSMGKFTLQPAVYLPYAGLYKVPAETTWYLQGELVGTQIWNIYLVKENQTFKVNEVKLDPFIES